jgi:hypothetical protein
MSDSRWGFGFDIWFIDLFNTRLVVTLNYNPITDLHTLQIMTAYAKSFPAYGVFTSSCLLMAQTVAIPLLPGSSPVWVTASLQLY